jgi:hypothetical protein
MPERLTELDVPFSTADTEGHALITFSKRRLFLAFKDWRLTEHRVTFEGVVAFKWDDNYLTTCEVAPDRVYVIEDSAWIGALREAGGIGSAESPRHFRFYFISESAALDVIAGSFTKNA